MERKVVYKSFPTARTENIVVYKSFPTEDATGHVENGKKSPIISEFN